MAYHRKQRKFGRVGQQRKQLLRSLARSVILEEKVHTTVARAKSVRPFVEKLVTTARKDDVATRRLLLARFNNDRTVVKKLIEVLGPKYKEHSGGYTRIAKVEPRPGSGRTSAVIEFV
ncbi:MAG: 50S ribosomal protein L17 [Candidatus Kaiserbacteria bacterium]|nr:50S ribosomal protein L17 [Candidatus Kaiserbacteria bacterium]